MPAIPTPKSELMDRPVFDLPALVRRAMDNRQLAAELVEKFTARLPQSVDDIRRLLASCDLPAAAAKVHTLKGEAGSLAATQLHAAAARLEQCLRAGRQQEAAGPLRDVQASASECLAACELALSQLAAEADGNPPTEWTPDANTHR